MSPTTTPPCPLCDGSMHWAVPPDGRTTRWWCDTHGCLGRREPESQIAAMRVAAAREMKTGELAAGDHD